MKKGEELIEAKVDENFLFLFNLKSFLYYV